MDDLEQQVNDPYTLAQIDQAMAHYRETTGKAPNTLRMFGWEWHQCDKGHWHKAFPLDG